MDNLETQEKKSFIIPVLIILIIVIIAIIIYFFLSGSRNESEILIKSLAIEKIQEGQWNYLNIKVIIKNNGNENINSLEIQVEIPESGTAIEEFKNISLGESVVEKRYPILPESFGKQVTITLDPNSLLGDSNREDNIKKAIIR